MAENNTNQQKDKNQNQPKEKVYTEREFNEAIVKERNVLKDQRFWYDITHGRPSVTSGTGQGYTLNITINGNDDAPLNQLGIKLEEMVLKFAKDYYK